MRYGIRQDLREGLDRGHLLPIENARDFLVVSISSLLQPAQNVFSGRVMPDKARRFCCLVPRGKSKRMVEP